MTRMSMIAHRFTVALMAVTVLVATGDGFAQSYAGLYHWALEHSLHGWKAESFPLMVDLFILVGELGMFALALEGHRLTRKALSWADLAIPAGIAAGGWIVSLVFNVGAVKNDLWDQLTAAVPPIASMLGLLVLLRTLHRLVSRVEMQVTGSTVSADLHQPELIEERPALDAWVPLDGPNFWPPFEPVERGQEAPSRTADVVERWSAEAAEDARRWSEEAAIGLGEPDVPGIDARVPAVLGVYPEIAQPFVAEIEQGQLPPYRVIKKRLGVGQKRAKEVREELAVLVQQ